MLLFVFFCCYLCCSIYCLCVNVYCHRVTTQMQLINNLYIYSACEFDKVVRPTLLPLLPPTSNPNRHPIFSFLSETVSNPGHRVSARISPNDPTGNRTRPLLASNSCSTVYLHTTFTNFYGFTRNFINCNSRGTESCV
jgi:hypothetical protein